MTIYSHKLGGLDTGVQTPVEDGPIPGGADDKGISVAGAEAGVPRQTADWGLDSLLLPLSANPAFKQQQ